MCPGHAIITLNHGIVRKRKKNTDKQGGAHKRHNRGSYMSAHVLLNLLNEVGKKEIKCEACRAFYLFLRNEFNKFNNTGARMLDSIYYMTLSLL